jgi:phage/plasmid-like protein (TIGR03299 family)
MINYTKMAEANGLGWNVSKVPLLTPDGTESGYYGIQRDDTHEVFGAVGKVYKPFQNSELFELADSVSNETNLPVHKAGMMKNGRLVYVQLLAGSCKGIGENNDEVQSYVTCVSSHDGTTPVKWGSTNLTISCMNTYHQVAKGMKSSARHTTKAIDNLRATMMQVTKVQDDIESNNELFKRLAEKSVSEQQVKYLIELISGVDFAKTPDQINNDHHGRQINRAKAIEDSIRKEMSYKGKTLWGLWSGVTHYTTHKAGRSEDARLANKLAGTGLQLDAMTLNRVSLWL